MQNILAQQTGLGLNAGNLNSNNLLNGGYEGATSNPNSTAVLLQQLMSRKETGEMAPIIPTSQRASHGFNLSHESSVSVPQVDIGDNVITQQAQTPASLVANGEGVSVKQETVAEKAQVVGSSAEPTSPLDEGDVNQHTEEGDTSNSNKRSVEEISGGAEAEADERHTKKRITESINV